LIDRVLLANAHRSRHRIVNAYSTDDLLAILTQAAALWADATYETRRRTAEALYSVVPLAPVMLDHGLDLIFQAVTDETMRNLTDRQTLGMPSPGALRSGHADGSEAFVGPNIIYHSLAGNVPGLSIPAVVCGVLARSVTIVRDSRRQPLLTGAFVDTIADIDPLVAAMILPVRPDVSADDARAALAEQDCTVELHGSDAVVAELSDAFSGIPTVQHGSRISAVIADGNAQPGDWAQRIAHDIAMYEGLGCLTPHTVFVEDRGDIDAWSSALAEGLSAYERSWPRRRQAVALEADRRAFLERAEVSSLLENASLALGGSDDAWCIVTSAETAPSTGPGMRCITVTSTADREHTVRAIRTMPYPIAGLGLTLDWADDTAAAPSHIDALKAATGATLVCPAGRMQAPPLAWEQDGGRRLGDLLDWRPAPS
jgi:hypothetical protein